MPTALAHPAVPLALAVGLGRNTIPMPLVLVGVAASLLPDLDVIGLRLGIPYAADLGHRGFSHSLVFAAGVALLGTALVRWWRVQTRTALWFIFLSAASHPLLDACTTGGLGVALFWPWSDARIFAPFRVIKVSPLDLGRFLSPRGLAVLFSEALWVWLPCLGLGFSCFLLRLQWPQTVPVPTHPIIPETPNT